LKLTCVQTAKVIKLKLNHCRLLLQVVGADLKSDHMHQLKLLVRNRGLVE